MYIHDAVLVLNANYEPINIATVKRAFSLIVKGVAHVEASCGIVRAGKYDYHIPSVIRLTSYRKIPNFRVSPSRRNIATRDDHVCQYCHKKFDYRDLTLDHIVPRCRGGKSTWDNLVAACFPCNNKKGDRTPEEAGMQLLRKPLSLSIHTNRNLLRQAGKKMNEWQPYLFY